MADPVDEYKIKFRSDPDNLDAVDWESCTATFYVRPFTLPSGVELTPLKVDEIIHVKVKDENKKDFLRIALPEPGSGDSYFPNFNIDFNREKVDQLVENSDPFQLTVKARVDPGLTQDFIFAGNPPKEVDGDATVKVEYPPPFIRCADFPSWSPSSPIELMIDTSSEVTEFKVALYKYVSERKRYEETNEILEISPQRFQLDEPEISLVAETHVFRTKRVIIGTEVLKHPPADLKNVGALKVTRSAQQDVPARNQPLTATIGYKPAVEAKLSIQVYLGDKKLQSFDSVSVSGERVLIYFPNLAAPAADYKASIRWKVIEPLRALAENSGFVTSESVDELIGVANPGTTNQCAGKTIDIVANPITKAEPISLNVTAGPKVKVVLKVTSDATNPDGTPAGNGIANADGRCVVTITVAHVTKDGAPYEGKVGLRFGADRQAPSKQYDDDYLTQVDASREFTSDSIRLRCNFHIASDNAMTKLPAVGSGGGREVLIPQASSRLAAYFDDHELDQVFPDGVVSEQPAKITLRPSHIEVKADPPNLPGPLTDHNHKLFTARLRATVVSASGRPVSQGEITSLYSTQYVKQERWRLRLDLRQAGYDAVEVQAFDIDDSGNIRFKDVWNYEVDEAGNTSKKAESLPAPLAYYDYDHERWCWAPSHYVFKFGPDMATPASAAPWEMELNAAFLVGGANSVSYEGSTVIKIGKQIRTAAESWDYTPFSLSNGEFFHNDLRGFGWVAVASYANRTRPPRIFTRTENRKPDGSLDVHAELAVTPRSYIEVASGQSLEQALLSFPQKTILVGDHGHHCLLEGIRFWHYLKSAVPNRASKWLNRDQMKMRKEAPRTRDPELDEVAKVWLEAKAKGRNASGDVESAHQRIFNDSWVYADILEAWLKNHTGGVAYVKVEVYLP
jgi:hypothetical protein